MTRAATASRAQITTRVIASLLGSYAFVWGLTTSGIALAVAAGMPFEDARTLLYLLVFPVFVACVCWTFTARRMSVVWGVLGGGGLVMTLAGWLLARGSS